MKTILTLLISALSVFSQAQNLPVLFNDNFNSTNEGWSVYDNENASCKISSGYYYLKNKTGKYIYRFYNNKYLAPDKDFEISAKLKQISGEENYGYGLIWHTESWRNGYAFVISSTGYFRIYSYEKEVFNKIKGWTDSEYINSKGKNNELKVVKKGNKFTFHINNNQVFETYNLNAHGFSQGFILSSKMMIVVDEISIKQESTSLNIVNGIKPGLKRVNLGTNINTKYSEIAPIISADGKTLFFGRTYLDLAAYPDSTNYDIYYSTKLSNNKWTKAQKMPWPINNEGDNLVISVSPDGNTLLLEGLYTKNGRYISDEGISISHKTKSGWEIPTQVIIEDYYNLDIYETYCPSPDGNVLVMSVERKNTKGEKDMYVSFRKANGTYTKPKNMGDVINTFTGEGTPFIAPDGKTMYMYSEGRPGFGSADIYVTKRLDETWLNWSKPKNLGEPVNSSDWDTYYTVSAKGDFAYLISTANSIGGGDVFSIQLAEEAKPEPVVLISGKVLNAKTNKPIGANIDYEDLSTGEKLGIARSNPTTGEYTIVLPYGKNYGARAYAAKFVSVNENFDFSQISEYQEINKNLYLSPIEIGQLVKMNNVFFVQGEAVLTKASFPELDRLVELMEKNPLMEIRLEGHTESGGKRNQNLLKQLSEDRVKAVKHYLVEHSIKSDRISGIGYGGSKPIVTGELDQTENRRVEFVITKN